MFQKSKEISLKIKELSEEQLKTKSELDKILSSIPNTPNDDVPIGVNENENKVIEIKNDKIESKCGWSPFDGYKFKGTPVYTIINGEIKMKDGKIIGEPSGKPIKFED